MKIFISWSNNSLAIAKTLKYLIKAIWDDKVNVFVSEEDLKNGEFYGQICKEVIESDALIACFTKENLQNPWIYFEAAIKMISKPDCVIPFCYNLEVTETYMLNRCQGVKYDINNNNREESLVKFVSYINNIALNTEPETFIPKNMFNIVIKQHLRKVKRKLDLINELNKSYNYFISYPIKGTTSNLKGLLNKIKVHFENEDENIKIFHAAGKYENDSELETYDTLGTIEPSKHFILILPLDISISSIFVEIGAAIAWKKKTITIFREVDDVVKKAYLPFILEKKINDKEIVLIEYKKDKLYEELMNYIKNDYLLNK